MFKSVLTINFLYFYLSYFYFLLKLMVEDPHGKGTITPFPYVAIKFLKNTVFDGF